MFGEIVVVLPDDIGGFVADVLGTVNFAGDFDVLFVMADCQ